MYSMEKLLEGMKGKYIDTLKGKHNNLIKI